MIERLKSIAKKLMRRREPEPAKPHPPLFMEVSDTKVTIHPAMPQNEMVFVDQYGHTVKLILDR